MPPESRRRRSRPASDAEELLALRHCADDRPPDRLPAGLERWFPLGRRGPRHASGPPIVGRPLEHLVRSRRHPAVLPLHAHVFLGAASTVGRYAVGLSLREYHPARGRRVDGGSDSLPTGRSPVRISRRRSSPFTRSRSRPWRGSPRSRTRCPRCSTSARRSLGCATRREANAGAYAMSLGLFVLGLCSKTVTATLPAALLVIAWWQRGRVSWRDDVVPLQPFLFILGIVAGLSTVWVERSLVGAEGAAFDLTPIERALIAGRALWFYAGKLLWPVNLVFIYPRWNVSQVTWWQYAYPLPRLQSWPLLSGPRPLARTGDRPSVLRRDALSGAGLLQRLSVSFLVRRRSLPVPGEPRIDRARRRGIGSAARTMATVGSARGQHDLPSHACDGS